ncbi:hypothetical protein H5410_032076 [Solanum commersonii]|uniref:DUF4283 domain-containing protein n=1 Tax=Solanum commersonii TaxID=4109 RepID=A0A9J5YK10_SOLCO|nr:hypothetical protein H5410_032076 [Solanum commersonii]
MAATAIGQPPPEVGLITSVSGEPQVIWEHEEVTQMIVNENLECAVIGKFSYGWPDIQDLRRLIPKQCELKGDCNIGLLSNRHMLIRASLLEDYAQKASSSERTISEVRSRVLRTDPKSVQKGSNMQTLMVYKKDDNVEELMTKSTDAGSRNMEKRENVATSRNLFISDYGEVRDNCYEEGEIPKGPDLIKEEEEVMQHKKDTEEDEDMDYNIQQISKTGDLSPRHTNNLKYEVRKGRPVIPLQVKRKSSRDRGSSINQ